MVPSRIGPEDERFMTVGLVVAAFLVVAFCVGVGFFFVALRGGFEELRRNRFRVKGLPGSWIDPERWRVYPSQDRDDADRGK